MNPEDAEVFTAEEDAERDASPRRYNNRDSNNSIFQAYQRLTAAEREELTRRTLYQQYQRLSPAERDELHRQNLLAQANKRDSILTRESKRDSRHSTAEVASIASSNASSSSLQLQAIRTARMSSRATNKFNRSESHPDALLRIETHRTQHSGTVGAGLRSRRLSRIEEKLPQMGAGKPLPPDLPEQEEYVVEFEGFDDPRHAQNWKTYKKLLIGAMLSYDAIGATMGSSIFSAAAVGVDKEFHVGAEVGTLGTSLFLMGYVFGPVIWAPMSELYGRRLPLLIGSAGFSIFAIGIAVAKDLQTVMISRFFNGLFGSCPLVVVGAAFADIFDNKTRGLAIAVFCSTVFMGPLLGPFIGGFLSISYLGWRWTEYISAIMGFSAFGLMVLFLPETYPPIILVHKASELRRKTKNWGIHAKQEEIEVDFKELLSKNLSRPLRILFTEPIVFLTSLYISFLYGILYLFLTAYAIVFQRKYGMNAGIGGLPYFGMIIGEVIAFTFIAFGNAGYIRKLQANNNIPVPEWRLPFAILGGVAFAAGLFWFGWTGYKGPAIPWIVPTLSGLFTGFGIFAIFLSLLNYIIDAYLMFAASALAANTFLRSLFGAIFPLFATYMFDGMGVEWAATLLGCVAVALVPMSVAFLLYGKKIRAKSHFAPAPDILLDKKRDEEARIGGLGNGFGHANGNGSGLENEFGGKKETQ